MLEQGVAKEVARTVLPLAMYTKYFWSCNPRSLMHFCSLRNSEQAQYEIREYAKAAESFLEQADAGHARRFRGERPPRSLSAAQTSLALRRCVTVASACGCVTVRCVTVQSGIRPVVRAF